MTPFLEVPFEIRNENYIVMTFEFHARHQIKNLLWTKNQMIIALSRSRQVQLIGDMRRRL